jgi:predicted DCC family thiol-disulfide oxidoreductase YuxK
MRKAEASAALSPAQPGVWFQQKSTAPLEIVRIGLGAALAVHYGLAFVHLLAATPWHLHALLALFLLCCMALILGWRTPWVKWLALIGHVAYSFAAFGVPLETDAILAGLLLILCIAPIGHALSLDRVREVRLAKHNKLDAYPAVFTSPLAFACTRWMQMAMAALLLLGSADRLRGWWGGTTLLAHNDLYHRFLLETFAPHAWLVGAATSSTALIEIAFALLVWPLRTRPYLLAAALAVQLQFALVPQLWLFSFVMIVGLMSFVRHEWLESLGAWWKRTMGEMEMIYDGHCGFCKRSMAWFLAFDGLGQIAIRDFRTNPSPVVSHEQLLKHLYLVLPDGRALPGFEAYRHVVLRVPGLWWQVPFFYVPVFSRLFGHPIYDWFAANRSRL